MGDSTSMRKMLVGLTFLSITCVAAVLGFIAAGWSVVDSIYMVVITIFGVGYGEVHPIDSTGMKVFTAFIIIAGCSSGIYVVGGFVQMVAEGEFYRALGARRMSKGIEQTSNHVIICGFGRVGRNLAEELRSLDQPFVCIDEKPDRIVQAEELGYLVVTGNAGEEETLIKAGIHRAAYLATVLPEDAANVFITLTARELTQELQIIARGESESTQRKLVRSGANHVVMPEAIGAARIANMISCPTADSLISDASQRNRLNNDLKALGLAIREVRVAGASAVAGGKIADLNLHDGMTLIVAILSTDGRIRRNPDTNEPILPGDILYVMSSQEKTLAVIRQVQAQRAELTYRGSRVQS
ncbi:potassium channel family protein [Rosistilla oblonga]|uniref:potassium channel family protein n=1 Tax=Rosistilla oblonga TaxID=2527990 RepID=UPI003A97AC5B